MLYKDIHALRLVIIAASVSVLGACATATPYQLSGTDKDNALVKGTAPMSFLAHTSTADIEAVDGTPIKSSERSVMLPPGQHVFSIQCSVPAGFGGMDFGKQDVSFVAEAGHVYQFDSDPTGGDPGSCVPYVYDATDGRPAYSEAAHIPLDKDESGKWHSLSSSALAGHTVVDVIPHGQYGEHWQQMIEIESWTKLMFPGSAGSFFQQQVANAKKNCPDTQVNVISESADDVSYEFEVPAGCAGSDVRSQFGRFLTGKLGIYHTAFISRTEVPDPQRSEWLKALTGAAVIDMK